MTTVAPNPVAAPKPAAVAARRPAAALAPPPAVLSYLRLHWLLILFVGTLIGAPAAYLAYSLLPGKFASTALLQVESNPFAVAGSDPGRGGVTAFDTYIKTQRSLIRSAFVLNSALSDPNFGISKLPTLADQRDPVKFLEEKLEVEQLGGELLKISFEGDRPEDVKKIVAAVTAAYLRECVEDDIKRKQVLKTKADGWKADLEKIMNQRLTPVSSGVVQAGGIVPAVGRAAAESPALKQFTFKDAGERLLGLKRELGSAPAELARLKAEDDDLAGKIKKVEEQTIPADVQAMLDKDPEVQAKRAEAEALRKQYQHMKRTLDGGDANVGVRTWKDRADEAAAAAEKTLKEKQDYLIGGRRRAESARMTEARQRVRTRFEQLSARYKELPKLIDDVQREVMDSLPPEIVQASATAKPVADPQTTDIKTMDGLYANICLQVERLSFELKSPPRVWERQAASNPSLKDGKKQLMATIAAGLLGFGLVGAGAVGVETRARKVCSLAELSASSPAPVVGVIPNLGATEVSRAAAAEAMDKLRSRVTQSYLARGCTTLAVTSPLGDEGKAFAAFGLANSLALAGFKTLLLDFDLRAPALHDLAGVPNADGVCELLLGEVDHRRAMIVMANGLHFIPAGAFSEGARAAAVGDRLAKLVSALGQPFDCVVLHGHALLAAAEAVEVARRADAVLLCSTYRETRLPLLKRAVDRLAVMEVPHAGIVYLGATTHEALC